MSSIEEYIITHIHTASVVAGDDVPIGVGIAVTALEIRSSSPVLACSARFAFVGTSNKHPLVACVQHQVVCFQKLVFGAWCVELTNTSIQRQPFGQHGYIPSFA